MLQFEGNPFLLKKEGQKDEQAFVSKASPCCNRSCYSPFRGDSARGLGQWGFALAFLIIVILFLLTLFVFWAILRANRDAGLGENNLPFTFNPIYRSLYSIVDPRPSRSAGDKAEQYQEELQPIVFQDHTEAGKSDDERPAD